MYYKLSTYYRGIFFLMLTMIVGCTNDVIAKFLGYNLDAFEIFFFRAFFGLITLLPFVFSKGLVVFRTKKLGFNIIRGILGAISMFLVTYSVINLPLAEITVIFWTIPLFILILSVLFLHEKVSSLKWFATIFGFIGLAFIIIYDKGLTLSFNIIYIVPIFSALLFAIQDVMIKKVIDKESRTTMLIYFALVTTITMSIPAFLVWKMPTILELLLLFLLGVGGNLIQFFIFKAYKATDLSALSQYRYIEFLFSVFFGYIFFTEFPHINVLIGALFLVFSTFYIGYSEHKKKKI